MPYRKTNSRKDSTQDDIVSELKKRGISVALAHDDILIGYDGRTYWFELKSGPRSKIRDSQYKLLDTWKGHFSLAWSLQMILNQIGYISGTGSDNGNIESGGETP